MSSLRGMTTPDRVNSTKIGHMRRIMMKSARALILNTIILNMRIMDIITHNIQRKHQMESNIDLKLSTTRLNLTSLSTRTTPQATM